MLSSIAHHITTILWAVRRRLVWVVAAALLVVGGGVGWWWRGGSEDIVRQEVEHMADLLREDFADNVSSITQSYRREYTGVANGSMRGWVVRVVERGPCWGFDVEIPQQWLEAGTGSVLIGDVRVFPTENCRL